jgi:Tfp pilus assembly protein PilN
MTMTRPPTVDTAPEKPRTTRRTWLVAVVTAVVALALGSFLGMRAADATKSPEYRAQGDKLATTESKLAWAEAALGDARESQADAEDSATDAADKLATFQGQLDDRKDVLRKREDALKKLRADLDDREARLDKKAANLAEREDDVTVAEELLAVTTVPGNGSYEVGADIEGGSYRSAGKRSCHYTVYGDAEGKDVLLDKTTAGAASVSLRAGTWFVTRGCAEWTRQ